MKITAENISALFRKFRVPQSFDLLSIDVVEGKLQVEPVKVSPKGKGSPWARELYELFAPVRQSLEGRSEEEINDAIDEAVKAVRAGKKK